MATKLVTVTWAVTVSIDIPDGVSNEELIDSDFSSREEVQTLACKAMKDASCEVNWKDGQIANVQETGGEDEPLTPDEEAELKEIVHKQNQRA